MFVLFFFFFNDTATTEIYTLSLHDALPISLGQNDCGPQYRTAATVGRERAPEGPRGLFETLFGMPAESSPPVDRKSTRLNSSHANISYAVFCLKKKKTIYWSLDRVR